MWVEGVETNADRDGAVTAVQGGQINSHGQIRLGPSSVCYEPTHTDQWLFSFSKRQFDSANVSNYHLEILGN